QDVLEAPLEHRIGTPHELHVGGLFHRLADGLSHAPGRAGDRHPDHRAAPPTPACASVDVPSGSIASRKRSSSGPTPATERALGVNSSTASSRTCSMLTESI